jgi:hypothetical protein
MNMNRAAEEPKYFQKQSVVQNGVYLSKQILSSQASSEKLDLSKAILHETNSSKAS